MAPSPVLVVALSDDALQLPAITWEGVALGLGVLLAGYVLGTLLGWLVGRVMLWRGRSPSASTMFSGLTRWLVMLLAFAAAVTVIFPSVRPVNALGGIGVLSIAAGIAFQTVLGNMFAGIVILSRDRFRVNDQIAVRDVAGTVTGVALTSTTVRTFDGRLVRIPNSVVHSEIVNEPPPQALLQEVGSATVRMDLRFWSGARQMETKLAQHEVIRAVLAGLSEAGVKTGSDVLVVEGGPGLLSAVGGGPA